MAAYIIKENPKNSFAMIPMKSGPGMKFDYAMAMGVRKNDKTRKAALDKLIAKKMKEIQAIIASYGVPILPIEKKAAKDDD
jgi:hypothetical protein